MLKSATILMLLTSTACAQYGVKDALLQEELNLQMCGYADHMYDDFSKECIYCAHGFHYDLKTTKCVGTPDVLGKCNANDHYHPATNECMYCAKGYNFSESSRQCEKKQ